MKAGRLELTVASKGFDIFLFILKLSDQSEDWGEFGFGFKLYSDSMLANIHVSDPIMLNLFLVNSESVFATIWRFFILDILTA